MKNEINISVCGKKTWDRNPGLAIKSAVVASLFLDTRNESWVQSRRPGCKWPGGSGRLPITWIITMPVREPTQSPATKNREGKEHQGKEKESAEA